MMIITARAAEIIEWIEDNCADTTYTLEERDRLFVEIGPEDRLIWDLRWRDHFLRGLSQTWFDNTPLHRVMIDCAWQAASDMRYSETSSPEE